MVFVSRETLKKTVKKRSNVSCETLYIYTFLCIIIRLKAWDFAVYKYTIPQIVYKYTSICALLYTSIQVFVYTCILVSTQYKWVLLTVSTRKRWMLTLVITHLMWVIIDKYLTRCLYVQLY